MTIWVPQLPRVRAIYLEIADAISNDIESEALSDGTRLPPQRDLASKLRVSIGTITRAYTLAERRGLVSAQVGRGTFVLGRPDEKFPMGQSGETVHRAINLSMMWPLNGLDPDLGAALKQLSRRDDLSELLAYQPNAGLRRHRESGAEWIRRHGFEVDPDQVVLCAGGQHAFCTVLAAIAGSNDTVMSEESVYPGFRAAANLLGMRVLGLGMDEEGLRPDAFEVACKTGRSRILYTVPTLQNPTTSTMSLERRMQIGEIARRYDVMIFEDAIHNLLIEDGPPTITSLFPDISFLIASPSKVVTGGLRVAYLATPERFVKRLSQNLWATTWMVPPLVAEIFAGWIEDGTADQVVKRKREEAKARCVLARSMLPSELLSAPGASYHAWLRLPREWPSAAAFVKKALANGVAVMSADAFHVGPGPAAKAVRLSLSATRSREQVVEALRRVALTLSTTSPASPDELSTAIV
ncbi:MAG: DNA-binding transcriptional MocR family regulator [Planctomycetota bacterium]|jgi:DNA-binding transcriptional MocR family regulator